MAAILYDVMSRCALIRISELKQWVHLHIIDAHSIYEGCSKNNVTLIVSSLLQIILTYSALQNILPEYTFLAG